MLEEMRKNSRSVIIYVLFGILIAVFILTFGPASNDSPGCGGSTATWAVKVQGTEVSDKSWRYAMMASGLASLSAERARARRVRETVIDGLIDRELFAQAAKAAGFTISTGEVEGRVARGEFYVLGARQFGQGAYFDESGVFDYDRLEMISKNLGLGGVSGFLAEQKKEMLAQKYRELLLAGVRVSPDEVLARYTREHSGVSIQYAKFEPRKYKQGLTLGDAEVTAWAAANEKALADRWERDKNLYTGGGTWIKARQIVVKKEKAPEPEPAITPEPPVPDATGDAGAPAAPAPEEKKVELPDPGLAKAQAALARLKAGEDFAKVAGEVSKDERSAKRGGLTEWTRVAAFGLSPEAEKALEALEPGKLSEVLETPTGFVIFKLEGKTDKDPTFEQVKADFAYEEALEAKAKELARADAEAALAELKKGTPIDQLFEVGDEVPKSPDDGLGEDDDIMAPQPGAKPPEPPKGKDGAGKPAAPKGPGAGAPPAPAVTKITTARLLPSGTIRRNGATVNGDSPTGYVGKSAELAKAVLDETAVGQLGAKVYEADGNFVIFKVIEKEEPDMAAFEKEKAELTAQLSAEKAYGVISAWKQQRCSEVFTAGGISVNDQFIDYGDVDERTGQAKKTAYTPCSAGGLMGLPPGVMIQ